MGLPTNDYLKIISQSYGPRKPLVVCEASSLDMLADLDCAEGSKATVGGTEYVLDRVNGWIEPGSGGGGGSDVLVVNVTYEGQTGTCDKTWAEINDAIHAGKLVVSPMEYSNTGNSYVTMFFTSTDSYGESTYMAYAVYFEPDSSFQPNVLVFHATATDDYPHA